MFEEATCLSEVSSAVPERASKLDKPDRVERYSTAGDEG